MTAWPGSADQRVPVRARGSRCLTALVRGSSYLTARARGSGHLAALARGSGHLTALVRGSRCLTALARGSGCLTALILLGLAGSACTDMVTGHERDLEILWPAPGAVMFDEEVLRARLRGVRLDDYEVYWYVDGSPERRMWNEWEPATPHKAYIVDTWFWNWRGRGPYTVGFIAEDRRGRELAHRTVRVYVE